MLNETRVEDGICTFLSSSVGVYSYFVPLNIPSGSIKDIRGLRIDTVCGRRGGSVLLPRGCCVPVLQTTIDNSSFSIAITNTPYKQPCFESDV